MPKYTLNYFPATGRGEPIRLMFVLAGVEYTDNHLAGEDWTKAENDSKFLPIYLNISVLRTLSNI